MGGWLSGDAMQAILPQHPDAMIVFCGDGHMRGELEGRAHQLGVQHAVRFLGTMSGECASASTDT
eukprot:3287901-Rhodomonas_salina.1